MSNKKIIYAILFITCIALFLLTLYATKNEGKVSGNSNLDGWIVRRYSNGQKKFEGKFIAGQAVGIHKWWYNNGQLKCITEEPTGLWRFWSQDGKLIDVTECVNGEGIMLDFYSDGKRKKTIKYKDGIANGASVLYGKHGYVDKVHIYKDGKIVNKILLKELNKVKEIRK